MTIWREIVLLLACITLVQNVDAGSLGLYGLPFRLIRKMRHKYDRDLIKNEDPAKYNREILDVMRTKNDRAPSRKNKKRQSD